jgi:hypothetical protein
VSCGLDEDLGDRAATSVQVTSSSLGTYRGLTNPVGAGQPDLAWWRLANLAPWYTGLLLDGMLCATLFVLVLGLPPAVQFDNLQEFWLTALPDALAFGLTFGLVFRP